MSTKTMSQIQIRIDNDTKQETKKVLEDLGLDISTAVKIMCRQIIKTGSFPLEIRDVNGFSYSKFKELESSRQEAYASKKTFQTVSDLVNDLNQ